MKTLHISYLTLSCALLVAAPSSATAATYVGTATYTGYSGQATSANDSPFFSVFGTISQQDPNPVSEVTSVYDFRGLTASVAAASGNTYFFLEDVQDGQFDTPGASFVGGVLARTGDGINSSNNGGGNTDNVAEDSLRLSSFRTTATFASTPASYAGYIRVDFAAASLGGQLPTYAGIVFAERTTTSLGTPQGNGRLIEAYDADNNLLERAFVADPLTTVADGFLGVSTTTGISYVLIAGDNEYDHFQYGFVAIPEPSVTLLGGLGCLLLLRRRR